jgi:hypothetical protein
MIATQNREWGFWGTFSRNWTALEHETRAAWNAAVKAITAAGYTDAEARDVLDGTLGRHMADQLRSRKPKKVAADLAALVGKWAESITRAVGRNPAYDKERAVKLQAARAKVERCEAAHQKAAIAYATAVAGQAPELPRRKRELRRAALALGEAIREESAVQ